jgi:hypothetical protein
MAAFLKCIRDKPRSSAFELIGQRAGRVLVEMISSTEFRALGRWWMLCRLDHLLFRVSLIIVMAVGALSPVLKIIN